MAAVPLAIPYCVPPFWRMMGAAQLAWKVDDLLFFCFDADMVLRKRLLMDESLVSPFCVGLEDLFVLFRCSLHLYHARAIIGVQADDNELATGNDGFCFSGSVSRRGVVLRQVKFFIVFIEAVRGSSK